MNLASDDPLFRQLSRLTPVVPDDVHSASVRARCHAALARQRRRRGPEPFSLSCSEQPTEIAPKVSRSGLVWLYEEVRTAPAADLHASRRWRWELAVAGGFAAVYLSVVIQQAMAMYGLR